MKPPSPFSSWVQQRRKALGLTQSDLAHLVGCAHETIRKIETGRRRPSGPMAERLARCLEIAPDELPHFLRAARQQPTFGGPAPAPTAESAPAPPSRAPSVVYRGRLPNAIRPLIGREATAQELGARLLRPDVRLLTITGLPGVGKTRLALRVAQEVGQAFEAGVRLVSLAPLLDPPAVAAAIAGIFKLPPEGDRPLAVRLDEALQGRQSLLVLDNFEHLAPAASVLSDLLRAAPGLKILATSRAVLRLAGEQVYTLAPLPVPGPADITRAAQLAAVPSVALFVRCAQDARDDFRLDERNAPAVAAICAAVEGLPLALELAAAWVRTLTCEEIALELGRGSDLLVSRQRDAPERQRSMEAVLDYSWALLGDEERAALAKLSVFRGGFDRQAAAAVAEASLAQLAALIDHSLLQQEESGRYWLHELVRHYAARRLAGGGGGRPGDGVTSPSFRAQLAHARHYLARAEEAGPQLYGPEQERWLARLDADHGNIRAALAWALDPGAPLLGERAALALRLATAIARFWHVRGHLAEGRAWLTAALELAARSPGPTPQADRLHALVAAGWLAKSQGDLSAAKPLLHEALALGRALADQQGRSDALDLLGDIALHEGEHQVAVYFYEEALALRRRQGMSPWVALSLYSLGHALVEAGEAQRGEELLGEALALARQTGDRRGEALALYALGQAALSSGDYSRASELLTASLARFHALGNQIDVGLCLLQLGDLTAEVASTLGEGEREALLRRAAQLWGAARQLLSSLGVSLAAGDAARHQRREAAVRAQLSEERALALSAAGAALTLDESIAYGMQRP